MSHEGKKNILLCQKAKASANVMVTVRVPINNFSLSRVVLGTTTACMYPVIAWIS